ncbi:MAG: hypothetical protein GXO78_09750 [Calditrichaeota bacterium]|nr:hypothetical protein [Calditrichota bacterium]
MKNHLKWLVLLLLAGALFAGAVVVEFRAEPYRDKIVLTWRTGSEKNVELFVVEKSLNNKDFVKIGEVNPKGDNSEYRFEDKNLSQLKNIFYYRLRIKMSNSSDQFTEALPVIPKISSIKRTWGSIKALFR